MTCIQQRQAAQGMSKTNINVLFFSKDLQLVHIKKEGLSVCNFFPLTAAAAAEGRFPTNLILGRQEIHQVRRSAEQAIEKGVARRK